MRRMEETMSYQTLLVEQREHVRLITLNQPERRNPLGGAATPELIAAIREADRDDTVHCIVLTGAGTAFSAGGDLVKFAAAGQTPAPTQYDQARASTELFKLPSEVQTPIIAAVNGAAMGGGCGMVAMAHLAIASEKAVFGTTEIKVGMFPYVIFPWILRAVGEKKALELALTGETFGAEEAREMGLVSKVVPAEQLMDAAFELANRIATKSPLVVKLGMDAYHKARDLDLKDSFDYLSTLRIVSFLSEDLKEGALSFLEKRAPNWQGR